MRALPLLVVALLAPLAAAGADAPPPPSLERGPVFALRGGVAVPSGDVARGGPAVEDLVERKIPLGFELGYRVSRRFWAELQFELAPGTPAASLCAAGTSCEASDVRVGAHAVLRLLPGAWLDPWLGVGVGVEVLNAKGLDGGGGARTERSWAGVELPCVEAGADVAISDRIGVGPWASLSFVRFSSESVRVGSGTTVSGAVHGRSVHRWASAGLQATLRL